MYGALAVTVRQLHLRGFLRMAVVTLGMCPLHCYCANWSPIGSQSVTAFGCSGMHPATGPPGSSPSHSPPPSHGPPGRPLLLHRSEPDCRARDASCGPDAAWGQCSAAGPWQADTAGGVSGGLACCFLRARRSSSRTCLCLLAAFPHLFIVCSLTWRWHFVTWTAGGPEPIEARDCSATVLAV